MRAPQGEGSAHAPRMRRASMGTVKWEPGALAGLQEQRAMGGWGSRMGPNGQDSLKGMGALRGGKARRSSITFGETGSPMPGSLQGLGESGRARRSSITFGQTGNPVLSTSLWPRAAGEQGSARRNSLSITNWDTEGARQPLPEKSERQMPQKGERPLANDSWRSMSVAPRFAAATKARLQVRVEVCNVKLTFQQLTKGQGLKVLVHFAIHVL